MKKILRSGADKVFYTICRNCSTEFTYQLADTTTEQLPLPILQNLFSSDSDVPQPMAGFGFGGT